MRLRKNDGVQQSKFQILSDLIETVSKEKNSVERQVSQFHLRALVFSFKGQDQDGDGITSSDYSEMLHCLKKLSEMGTESILFSEEEEESCSSQRT